MRPIMAITRSLGVTQGDSRPSKTTRMFFCRRIFRVWVASTCSTSLVPMPMASVAKAPWVAVWESPQTMVMPGRVSPCSGPITCTIPWRASTSGKSSIPNSAQLSVRRWTCRRATRSAMPSTPACRSRVGTA